MSWGYLVGCLGATMTIADDLSKLAELKKNGDLSEDQYQQACAALLGQHRGQPQPEDVEAPEPFVLAPPPPEAAKKKKRKFLGLGWFGWGTVSAVVVIVSLAANAETSAERKERLRTTDPVAYASLIAKEEADAAAKAERDKLAAEERAAKEEADAAAKAARDKAAEEERAAMEQARRDEENAKLAEAAEEKRRGFHCLSGWDGSQRNLVEWTKKNLNDPGSFEHDETRISPVDGDGTHTVFMDYRAKNGFGGVVRGSIVATIKSSDCSLASVISSS